MNFGARANYFGSEHDSSTASTLNNRTIDGLHRAAFTRLLRFDLGQPFYGWFRMANPVLQPISTGLVDRLQTLLALIVLVSFLSRDVAFDHGRS
jgi:hypothetical protein